MRWEGRRGSRNIDDRRSMRRPMMAGGGLASIVLILVVVWLGGDPTPLLQNMQAHSPSRQVAPTGTNPADDKTARFVSVVLADTEEVWARLFRAGGRTYREPTLVLFRDQVSSACGYQSAATGPFYCPSDEHVYIDLSFYDEMVRQLGAPGDFAQAYVIAHEIGHHVQKLLGISDKVHRAQNQASEQEANELSVRLELQADFLAGVWAHHAQQNWQFLEPGDIEEALNAATAIGDDRLQMQSRGVIIPESFTHGTAEQRARWFSRGLETGDMTTGETFALPYEDL